MKWFTQNQLAHCVNEHLHLFILQLQISATGQGPFTPVEMAKSNNFGWIKSRYPSVTDIHFKDDLISEGVLKTVMT